MILTNHDLSELLAALKAELLTGSHRFKSEARAARQAGRWARRRLVNASERT
jgi:cob(I)alamin adenosyltransferase